MIYVSLSFNHRCTTGGGGGGVLRMDEIGPPGKFNIKLVNKNAIQPIKVCQAPLKIFEVAVSLILY
jgi:hypothetical protein